MALPPRSNQSVMSRNQSVIIAAPLSCDYARVSLAKTAIGVLMSGDGPQFKPFHHLARMLLESFGVS
jgi:hypothetical protein